MSEDGLLPSGVVARIDVSEAGVRVVLRDGMTRDAFAELLRMIADAFEAGTIGP
jgi:hypothetical protein